MYSVYDVIINNNNNTEHACYRYLAPASVDSCDAASAKQHFDAVIRCFEIIGFKSQVANVPPPVAC